MRNLKKILALVLALVMSFSVMTVSSAAFKDEANISENYAESIEVLSAIGVFRGDENGKFNPQKSITRAEVAAIIYRITTGDVEDVQAGFYADLNMFTDVAANDWFAGYVNYCASAEYIKGRGDGTFDPQGKITGYDALTMILRAIGYDQNGEFTGESYTVKVAQIAKERGITDTLKGVALGTAATREVIAEILFNTINVQQVEYTLAFGYSTYHDPLQKTNPTETLGYEMFYLWNDGDQDVIGDGVRAYYGKNLTYDDWGVPSYNGWFLDYTGTKTYIANYDYLITCEDAPVIYESYEAAYECDVAKEIGLTKDALVVRVTENADEVYTAEWNDKTKKYEGIISCGEFDGTINLKATKTLMGAQGRWTRIFSTVNGLEMVMMDQFLAQVVDVTKITYDRNGHVKAPATVTLNIYDATWADNSEINDNYVVWTNSKGDFDYTVGELVLLYHEANYNDHTAVTEFSVGTKNYTGAACEIIGAPETLNGRQTAYVVNKACHIVAGVEYPDAIQLNVDECGLNTQKNWTWVFDTHGNVIASLKINTQVSYQYGVISAIKWVDEYNTLSDGYALTEIIYVDGTKATVNVATINGKDVFGIEGKNNVGYDAADDVYNVSSTKQYNDATYTAPYYGASPLYVMYTDAYGYTHLTAATLIDPATNPGTNTGVSKLGYSDYYATHATQFMVLTYDQYGYLAAFETYTGINEIPTYTYGKGIYYVVADKNNVADVVYIINPTVYGKEYKDAYTFFSFKDDALEITHTLVANDEYLYTISGGLVDGEYQDITVRGKANEWIVNYITSAVHQGELLNITISSKTGDVTDVKRITDVETNLHGAYKEYAVYAGSAADAWIKNGVLFTTIDGVVTAYNLEDANVITEYLDLEDTLTFAKRGEKAYLYVMYTKSGNEKAALNIFITNVPGTTNRDLLPEVYAAMDKVEELEADLAAATEKLNSLTSALDLTEYDTAEELVKLIGELKAALAAAIEELNAAIEDANKLGREANIEVAEDLAEAVVEIAETTIEVADELVVAVAAPAADVIKVESVEAVYAVGADTAAKIVAANEAVCEKVAAIEAVAALIKDNGAVVTVATEATEIADEMTFVVTLTIGEATETYTITVKVTATEEKAAE